jgi:hypothetical protein
VKISILIPDLLQAQPAGGLLDRYHDLRLPELEYLFAHSALKHSDGCGLETYLLKQFHIADPLPTACYTQLADGGTANTAYCLRADPVHLQAQRDQLVLVDGEMLAISAAEADALTATLNQHFAQDKLRFIPSHPTRWYIALDTVPDLITHPLPIVAGRAINERLPKGAQGQRWNQIINEAQMLLHAHPVNQMREERGQVAINSIWMWGGGAAQVLTPASWDGIWADDALARGLAIASQTRVHDLPPQATPFLVEAKKGESHLVVLDGLRRAAWYGDDAAWREGLTRIDTHWIKPLLQALRGGRISELTLHAISEQGGLMVTSNRAWRWQFWRRNKSLKHYLSEQ